MKNFRFTTSIGISLLFCFGFGLCTETPAKTEKPIRKGVSSMSNTRIQLQLSGLPERTIIGGGIHATIVVKNISDKVISIPALAPISPVLFTFENAATSYKKAFSHQSSLDAMQSGRSVPRMELQPVSLKPGDSVSQKTGDLATYAGNPFPEGDYQVTASLRFEGDVITAPVQKIRICAPLIGTIETLYSTQYATALSVFVEEKCFAPAAIFVRESIPLNPELGFTGYPFAIQKGIEGIAACEKVGSDISGRWIARLSRGKLVGSWGDINLPFKDFGEVETDLKSAVLHPRGYTVHENAGMFFITGKKQTKTFLQSCVFTYKTPALKPPIHLSDNDVPAMSVQYDASSGNFLMLWIEQSASAGCSIKSGRYRPDHDAGLDGSRTLLTLKCLPAALAMEPTTMPRREQGTYAVLFVDEKKKQLSFIQDDVASQDSPVPVIVPLPPGPCKAWAVAPAYDYHPLIVAQSGDHLMWYEIEGDKQWKAFAHDSTGVSRLSLYCSPQNEYWAHWVNTETGLRFERIPYMIKPAR